MASKVDGLIQKIKSGNITHGVASTAYGVCETVANEAAKTVDMTGFTLLEGTTIHIKFNNKNIVASPTLNVQGTGAKTIKFGDMSADIDGTIGWRAGDIVEFTYDGANWIANNAAYAARAGNISIGNIQPLATKTYTTSLYNSSSGANYYQNFISVTPIDYNAIWIVRYKLTVTASGHSDYTAIYDVSISGRSNTYYSYRCYNSLVNYPIYSHTYLRSNSSSTPHELGVRIASSYGETSVTKTLKVELLEQDNCTVTLLDSLKLYTSSTPSGYAGWSTFNATTNGLQEQGDSNDTAAYVYSNGFRGQAGANKIYPYTLFAKTGNGKYESFIMSSTTAASKTVNTHGFIPEGKIYYNPNSTTYNEGAFSFGAYEQYHSLDYRYTFNIDSSTLPDYCETYLVWTYNTSDGLLYLDTTQWLATELPSTEDNKIYQRIGSKYYASSANNWYQGSLLLDNPYYEYKNGNIRIWQAPTYYTENAYVKKNGDTMTGDLTLSSTSGDSPAIIFDRGNSLTDWRLVVISGKLSFQSRTSTNDFVTRGSFGDNNGAFAAASYNGLTLTKETTGFTIAGGTTSKTLTVLQNTTLNGGSASYLAYYSAANTIGGHGIAHFSDTYTSSTKNGKNELVLGNMINSDTNGSAYGQLALYSSGTKGTYLKANTNSTEWYTATLQAKTGTIALTSDLPTWSSLGGGDSGKHADSYFVKAITSTDNAIVRFDGTNGQIQNSGVIINDKNMLTIPGGSRVYSVGLVNQSGYVKWATLTISGSYQNEPIVFEISRRGDAMSTTINIQFQNSANSDPTLTSFTYYGSCTNIYIKKSATSTWDLYASKTEAYDSLQVLRYHNPYNSQINVEWKSEHIADAVEDWTQVSIAPIKVLGSNVSGTVSPSSHIHGNITNDGKIGSTANYAIYTTTNGVLTAGSLETAAPSASGNATAFITSVSQDSKGKISATKANLDTSGTWSGTATKATTTANTSNDLYLVGVKSGATSTLLHDTGITINNTTLSTNGIIRTGRYFHNVATFDCTNTPKEIFIKTKIPFVSGQYMPKIILHMYNFISKLPTEIGIAFYIYNNAFDHYAVTSNTKHRPKITLCTYIESDTKYVGIGLGLADVAADNLPDAYYIRFNIDYLDIWPSTTRTAQAFGWKVTGNSETTSIISTTDRVTLDYVDQAQTAKQAAITSIQYGIAYYSDTTGTFAGTGAGTSGQYLKSNGTSAPTWATFSNATVGLGNVENTKLSTWAGTSNITTVGTITSGTWHGTKIANDYLANSSITIGASSVSLGGTLSTITGPLSIKTNGDKTKAFIINRSGSGEATSFWQDDQTLHIDMVNDETSAQIKFELKATDTESGGGSGAQTSYITFNGASNKSTIIADYFSGNGSSLTNLNGSNIASGTVPSARLPIATSDVFGAVKTGSGITNTNGVISVSASNLGLSNALHFLGVSTTAITDGGTENPTIGGTVITNKVAGDVVIDNNSRREYVWSTTNKWEMLGFDASQAYSQATSGNTFISKVSQATDGTVTAESRALDTSGTWSGNAAKLGTADKGSARQAIYLSGGTATAGNYTVAHTGNAGKSNMNDVGRQYPSTGMTNLTSTSNADTPRNGTTYSSGWHLYWDTSYQDDPNGSNSWVAQIVNKAGTNNWWVRSRNGSTITNGTAWTSSWRHLVTSTEAAVGTSTNPVYINANGEAVASDCIAIEIIRL